MNPEQLNDCHEEFLNAIDRASIHGSVPESGPVVADAYRDGLLPDCGIGAMHIIGELLDRIHALKESDQ